MRMFSQAIVRRPGRSMTEGITSAPQLGKPDHQLALRQHDQYIHALQDAGLAVTILDPLEAFPDSCFIEDAAVLTRRCAVITRPGAASRLGEIAGLDAVLSRFYDAAKIERIQAPGTLDGGDVMMVGDVFYIGRSARTNQAGAEQLCAILARHGLAGTIVSMSEVLHLKTGLAYLEDGQLLVAGEFIQHPAFANFTRIEVPAAESYAANCIRVNECILMPAGYPRMQATLERLGHPLRIIDTSEFRKLDGGLSCLSLRF